MAAYLELYSTATGGTWTGTTANTRNRLCAAVLIAAEVVRDENSSTPNHDARIAWALRILADPFNLPLRMASSVVFQNRTVPLTTMNNWTDAQAQAIVDAAVDRLAAI